ncbi:hypothetical protein J1N35_015041 [Gossypium stocksii]|uniref:Uncharacterized protein n=1 Tax=Gossypium stocksii TaxID=47602 RepID=A0A9D4A9H6_9ROSI|nr:hypothetical protein J1N35_015041 [Gossypium stocksii]
MIWRTRVLSVEGRLLKSLSKNDSKQSSHARADTVKALRPPSTKTLNFGDSVEDYKQDFRPTTPRSRR